MAVVADQMVLVGNVVTLSGEGSSDPDGDPLQYTWRIRSLPPLSRVELDSSSGATARFSADRAGVVVIDLVVSDGELDSAPATAIVGVLATEDSPMAFAGPDRTVRKGARVFVSGIQSRDPNNLPLFYDWALISKPAGSVAELEGSTKLTAHFSADVVGKYEVELIVHNGSKPSVADRVTVTAVEPDVVIPGDVPNGVLNPDEVYIFGTLAEGSCDGDAIAHWSAPNVAVVGFGCYANESTGRIRNDGTLIYTNTFEDKLREFHCDGCPWTPSMPYPSNVLANDTILATPPCDMTGISGFIIGVTGERLHRCGATWYNASGVAVSISDEPLSYGYDNKVLTQTAVVDIATGERFPISGLPTTGATLTTRVAGATSFWMVSNVSGEVTLWRIDHAGGATLEGTYPAPPANNTPGGEARLDGSGNLFQEGYGPASFEDVVIYRSLNGLSEVVYTETSNPAVKMHISSLITGP